MPDDSLHLAIAVTVGVIVILIGIGIGIGLHFMRHPERIAGNSSTHFRDRAPTRAPAILRATWDLLYLRSDQKEHEQWRKRFIERRETDRYLTRLSEGAMGEYIDSREENRLFREDDKRAADKALGKVWEPSPILVVSVWLRRLTYLWLVAVLAVGFYVITEPVLAVVAGSSQSIPAYYGLLQHRQLFTGIVLISCVALAGLLIAEYPQGNVALKIAPFTPRPLKVIYLMLAMLMALVDVGAIAALAIVGIDFQAVNHFPAIAALIALMGMVFTLALGLFLSFNAMLKNLYVLGCAVLGAPLALGILLPGLVAAAGSRIRNILRKPSRH